MVESSEAGGPEQGPGSKAAPSFESMDGRLRFTVELIPGETKIVSWKKLLREYKLSNSNRPESSSGPPSEARRSPVSEPPPSADPSSVQKTEDEQNDLQAQAGSNRLSNVIERIERMYAGNGSSDEEDLVLDNVPDDDEYDTEDSFIDDAELDDYFQVDNSAIKHDGFFVNRGKLERLEPIVSKDQQPKKRRRKDLTKGSGSDDGHNPHKIMKMENKGKKASSSIQISSTSQSHKEATPNVHMLEDPQANAAEISLKMTADIEAKVVSSGLQNGDAIKKDVDTNQQKPGVFPSNNLKESELQDTSAQRSNDKKSHAALIQRKEGSSVRPKSSMLEKAIRDLEKMVAEFRPPSTEAQDPDIAAQAVKKRLPPEIKQKLAKVARIAQAAYGKVPKDVVSRLMSIVGHLMHITTLKRNLKAMANMELSAKQEKDDQIQKIKQEVSEMVKLRILHTKSKLEQHDANSDKEAGVEDKEALKRKYSIDDVLENKICDLYDLYVERVEEDSGPPVRRLYEELALLWPSGVMHIDGIKRAIYRSKDRKGLFTHKKDREKIKKKKVLPPKAENASNVKQASHNHGKSLSDSHAQRSTLANNPSVPVANRLNQEKLKQGKMKKCGSSSSPPNTVPSNVFCQKKVKQKSNPEVTEAQLRLEKPVVSPVEKRPKHLDIPRTKLNLQPPAPSGPST